MNNTSVLVGKPPGEKLNNYEKISMTVGLVVLCIITVCGNLLVIMTFSTCRRLRNFVNHFIVSLAISDMLVALISMPLWINFVATDMNVGIYKFKLFKAWACFDIMFGVASILNLTAVSVDRYIHITHPLLHESIITRTRVFITIISIWVISLGVSLIKGLNWEWARPNFELLSFCVGFGVPMCVIIFCYARIYSVVRKQLKKMKIQCVDSKKSKHLSAEVKAIKTIAVVILAFAISWCPFFILNLIYGLCNCTISQHIITFSKWLHYCNSAINPIIYACSNRDYRKAFKKVIYQALKNNWDDSDSSRSRKESRSYTTTVLIDPYANGTNGVKESNGDVKKRMSGNQSFV